MVSDSPRSYLFDEIQRVERWNEWLKNAVDEERHRFLLTGSSALTLREGAIESGFRRWKEVPIEGLSYREFLQLNTREGEDPENVLIRLPNAFERYLALGGLPEHADAEPSSAVRRDIREEIVEKALLRELVSRVDEVEKAVGLFVYIAKYSGAIFNQSARASDLGVDPKTVPAWRQILENSHLIVSLDRYTSRRDGRPAKASKVALRKPKLFPFDHGIVTAFAETPSPETVPEIRSRVMETVVFRHLREVERTIGSEGIFYHRDQSGELDFLLPLPDGLVAVEVKSGGISSSSRGKTMRAAAAVGANKVVVVHGSDNEVSLAGAHAVRIDHFALDPSSYLAWDQ